MSHYDEQWEEEDRQRRMERAHRIATRHAEIKESLRDISKFVRDRGDSRLSNAWETFKAELTYYRYNNEALIENPNILLEKLTKVKR